MCLVRREGQRHRVAELTPERWRSGDRQAFVAEAGVHDIQRTHWFDNYDGCSQTISRVAVRDADIFGTDADLHRLTIFLDH